MGWCSLDPKRLPLTGLEMRGCWEQRLHAGPPDEAPDQPPTPRLRRTTPYRPTEDLATPARTFVPVELLGPIRSGKPVTPEPEDVPPAEVRPIPIIKAELEESWVDRTNLFGDLDG